MIFQIVQLDQEKDLCACFIFLSLLYQLEFVLGLKVMRIRGSDVCRSRECGGLGIKSVSPFNFALLGK